MNAIERCFVEVRRRTRPMVGFVNVQSVERTIYSVFQKGCRCRGRRHRIEKRTRDQELPGWTVREVSFNGSHVLREERLGLPNRIQDDRVDDGIVLMDQPVSQPCRGS